MNKSINKLLKWKYLAKHFRGLAAAAALTTIVASPVMADEFLQSVLNKYSQWTGTWSTAPLAAEHTFFPVDFSFENQTIRQVARFSIGGDSFRVRLSNQYGDVPLVVGALHVAIHDGEGAIIEKTDKVVTVSDKEAFIIPPGAEIISDPISLRVRPCDEVAVSMYLPEKTPSITWHETGLKPTFISTPGNFVGSDQMPLLPPPEDLEFEIPPLAAYFWLTGIDVKTTKAVNAMVAFGDSITDGVGSTINTDHSWPDLLSESLNCKTRHGYSFLKNKKGRLGILNMGISGNRILSDMIAQNGLARFNQDVLGMPGVNSVFLALGINDIGFPGAFGMPVPEAEDVIWGIKQMITRAKGHGLKVYAATLTPCENVTLAGYYSEESEAARTAINEWIRTTDMLDGFADFDKVVQDPNNPKQLLAEYDSGDHLHPSNAGYEVMATAVEEMLYPKKN